jgi:hypothetical protein
VCVCLVRRRSVTRRYSRVLRDRGNAGSGSCMERVVQCYTHTHTWRKEISPVRYLILLVVNIVCVFEWHIKHTPLVLWRRTGNPRSGCAFCMSAISIFFHAKAPLFGYGRSRWVICSPIGIYLSRFYCLGTIFMHPDRAEHKIITSG